LSALVPAKAGTQQFVEANRSEPGFPFSRE
jgi:hypothetical protein